MNAVGARQNVQFYRQNICFLKNKKTLSKFLYDILHYLISVIKSSKKSVHKSQFYINHVSQEPELRTLSLSYVELWSEHKLFVPVFDSW